MFLNNRVTSSNGKGGAIFIPCYPIYWCQIRVVGCNTSRKYIAISKMSLLKTLKKREPLWKEWDKKANKEGVRAPVYAVNGDVYTREWLNNEKHGL